VAETAVQVALPNAAGAAPSGAEVAEEVVQPDVVAAAVAARPGAVAEEVAQPDVAVAPLGAQDAPEGELPSGVAWAFRQDPALPSVPPRSAPTARAMGWS
jgi:hypothetical protein